mgnify:CR=1 FL=1
MDIEFGDIQETALVTLAIRASETARPNPRIRDEKAAEIINTLGVDVSKYDPFLSHEGVVARTIMGQNALTPLSHSGRRKRAKMAVVRAAGPPRG